MIACKLHAESFPSFSHLFSQLCTPAFYYSENNFRVMHRRMQFSGCNCVMQLLEMCQKNRYYFWKSKFTFSRCGTFEFPKKFWEFRFFGIFRPPSLPSQGAWPPSLPSRSARPPSLGWEFIKEKKKTRTKTRKDLRFSIVPSANGPKYKMKHNKLE